MIQKCNPLKSQSDTTKSRYCKNHPTPQKKGTKQNQYPKSNIPKISLNVYVTYMGKFDTPKTHIPPNHGIKVGTLDVQNRGPKSDYQRITKSITKIDNKFHDVTKRFHDMTKSWCTKSTQQQHNMTTTTSQGNTTTSLPQHHYQGN